MSTLFVDTINEQTTGNGIQIPGHVVQIKQARKTNKFTHTANSSTWSPNIYDLEVTLTPSSVNSKILIIADVFAGTNNNTYSALWQARLMRGSTNIETNFLRHHAGASGDNGSGGGSVSSTFLDSPSTTSSVTYGIQIRQIISSGSLAVYVNGTQNGANGDGTASSIIAMEIAG